MRKCTKFNLMIVFLNAVFISAQRRQFQVQISSTSSDPILNDEFSEQIAFCYINNNVLTLGELEIHLEKSDLLLQGLVTQWDNCTEHFSANTSSSCLYTFGYVNNRNTNSWAAFTICPQSITGFFSIGHRGFTVSPVSNQERGKRSAQKFDYFNLTNDADFASVSDKYEVETNELHQENKSFLNETYRNQGLGYVYDSAWQPIITRRKRKFFKNPKKWLELVVAVDESVIKFHGKLRVEQYVLTLMNIVNAIYQDPSLDANMQLVLKRLMLFELKVNTIRLGNAKKSLENVNLWNKQLHRDLRARGEYPHDVAVWLTRAHLGGPSGYAPVSGACDPTRSCALTKDEGLSSAFIIAHEIAHILGLTHDGDQSQKNPCRDEALLGSVMAPMVSSTFHHFIWSDCSRKEFLSKSKTWKCLLNPPSSKDSIRLNSTLEAGFTMDEQCRVEFGEGYSLCDSFEIPEPCAHLWCGHEMSPLVCKTKKSPPLEGTECGVNKWCVNGYCERIPNGVGNSRVRLGVDPLQYRPQNGGWGNWSRWGYCSRSCGVGAQFRLRKCDSPEPLRGGADCTGAKEEWKICNHRKCPEPAQDFRALQCARMPKMLNFRSNLTWLPYESDLDKLKCKLFCLAQETGEIHASKENLVDGTQCSYDNPGNICVQGKCQDLGCDMRLNSIKREDFCGVCNGNNFNCTKILKKFKKTVKKEFTKISVLHRLAREIDIKIESSGNFDLLLKDRRRNTFRITFDNITDNQILFGTKFHYSKSNFTHRIWAKGPCLEEVIVLIHNPNKSISKSTFQLQYYIHKETDIKYEWIIGGWGPCSRQCGGGKRVKTKACREIANNRIVPRKFCPIITKPESQSEPCNNFSCNFVSVAGPWEPCSATCGTQGLQNREIYCVPQIVVTETVGELQDPWKYMLSPDKCGGDRPLASRICSRTPCPGFWQYSDWTPCSPSCGHEVSYREVKCNSFSRNESNYNCPNEMIGMRQSKLCEKSDLGCKPPCFGNQSKFCGLESLKKYCEIPEFRELCCKSCDFSE